MAETNGLWGWWTTSRNTPAGCEKGLEAIKLVCFTDAEHNGKTNVILEFERSVKVRHQVVARTMHHFTLEVKEMGSGKKLYKARCRQCGRTSSSCRASSPSRMPQSPDLRYKFFHRCSTKNRRE